MPVQDPRPDTRYITETGSSLHSFGEITLSPSFWGAFPCHRATSISRLGEPEEGEAAKADESAGTYMRQPRHGTPSERGVEGQDVAEAPADRRQWTAIGACSVLLLGAVLPLLYLSSHGVRGGGEPSAELSFTNPSHIDSWTGPRSVTFQFLIRNLAEHRHTYRYAVAVSRNGSKASPRGSEVVELGPGESRVVSWTETSPPRGRFKVSVSVPGTDNRIHFWTHSPS